MEIVNIAVDKLVPYENNPRNNTEAIQYVANSIKEFGFKVPLVIDSDNVVICGHTRLLAAKQLGLKDVPCVVADDLTDEQIKAQVYVSPVFGKIEPKDIVDYMKTYNLQGVRLQLQIHKFIWPPDMKGV